jgi:hypothetical protein
MISPEFTKICTDAGSQATMKAIDYTIKWIWVHFTTDQGCSVCFVARNNN